MTENQKIPNATRLLEPGAKELFMQRLEKNVSTYSQLKKMLDDLEAKADLLKADNLQIMQMLDINWAEFPNIGLQIQLIKPTKKISVDEAALIRLVGMEKVSMLRVVPVKAVEGGVNGGILPKEALGTILTEPGDEYTKITRL